MKSHSARCNVCNKMLFASNDTYVGVLYEDFERKILHDEIRCHNFLNFKKIFEGIEDNLQTLRITVKQLQEAMF